MASLNDIPASLGKIILNLQSLEFTLRLFLYETQKLGGSKPEDYANLTVGKWVSENPLTSYDTLGQLISKVNTELQNRGLQEKVDISLVDIRDALAHGRFLANQPNGPYRLFKFSRPKNGKVQVTVSLEMDSHWFADQIRGTLAEINKIVKIGRALGLTCFPTT